MPRLPRALLLAGLAAASALALTGCGAAAGASPDARVVVRIAPTAHPVDYEVHLARADGGSSSVHRMRTGQTRSFAMPAGWVTVRIAGLCVVPARNSGTAVVEVGGGDCRLA